HRAKLRQLQHRLADDIREERAPGRRECGDASEQLPDEALVEVGEKALREPHRGKPRTEAVVGERGGPVVREIDRDGDAVTGRGGTAEALLLQGEALRLVHLVQPGPRRPGEPEGPGIHPGGKQDHLRAGSDPPIEEACPDRNGRRLDRSHRPGGLQHRDALRASQPVSERVVEERVRALALRGTPGGDPQRRQGDSVHVRGVIAGCAEGYAPSTPSRWASSPPVAAASTPEASTSFGRKPQSTPTGRIEAARAVSMSTPVSPTKATASGGAPSASARASAAAGSGLRGTPGRSPTTAPNFQRLQSASTIRRVGRSGLLLSTPTGTPADDSPSSTSGMPGKRRVASRRCSA